MTSLRILTLVVTLSLCGVAQQTTQVIPSTSLPVIVPRLIRFSGQLPGASGTVGITFTLHKGQQDETALWIETQNVQLDSAGKYTVLLGVTKPEGIPTDLFSSGEAQWLGIQVQGKTEQPRVLLVSVPYALRAAEADTLAGRAPADFITTDKLTSAVQHELQAATSTTPVQKNSVNHNSLTTDGATNFTDTTTNQVVMVTQKGTGAGLVATAGNNVALSGTSTNTAIYGSSNGASHATAAALEGVTTATQGRGIFGWANTTTGFNFGLYGQANSVSGTGIAAVSTATSGATVGMEVQNNSPKGIAAVMQARGGGKIISGQSGSGNTEVFSVDGTGKVTGNGSGLSNVNAATLGGTAATAFPTLSGINYFTNYQDIISSQSGYSMYVYNGDATDAGGSALVAVDENPNGYGLYGEADGGAGIGVYGFNSGGGYGVYGVTGTASTTGSESGGSGAGVWADSKDWVGLLATADRGNASFMVNNSPTDATLLIINESSTGNVFEASGVGMGSGYCNLDNMGDLTCSGSVSNAYPTSTNRTLSMYAVQATENWYEDIGTAQLTRGSASVHFDPNFMEAVNTSMPYQVFLTPKGDSKGLYVSNEGPGGFEVHESGGGTVTMAFDYRIVAKRKGKESLRMQDVTDLKRLARRPASRGMTVKPIAHPRPSAIQQRSALIAPKQ